MRPGRSIITHLSWLLMIIILLATMSIAIATTRISSRGVTEVAQLELADALAQSEDLLRQYAEGQWTREELQALLNPAFLPGDWYVQLYDAAGELIAQTDGASEWFAENHADGQRIVLLDELGQEVVRGIAGIDVQSSYSHTVTQGDEVVGAVHLGRQMTVVEAKSTLLSQRIILMMMGLFLLLAIFLYVMARWVVVPVYRLVGATRAMAAGDFRIRANEKIPGELGYLSATFNNMADELSETFAELSYERSSMEWVLEGLNDGILAIDKHGNTIHRNGALKKLLGERQSELERRIVTMLADCLRDGENRQKQYWIGEDCFEVTASPIRIKEHSGAMGAVAMVRDVTMRQKLEKTRHDYVANITHELRTPLATMRGLMEPLADGIVEDPADQKRYFGIVLSEIQRLSRLVNDMLELSGLQSGRATIEMEPVDATQLLYETKERFAKAYGEKGVHWKVDLPQDEILVRANEDRISQVLTVLVDNALKYTNPGGKVMLSVSRQEGERLRFSVRDTGVGISAEHLPFLFDRFYQADRSHSERGNGLGLSIAQEVLEKMELSLAAESVEGQGSCFWFDVPLWKSKKR